MASNKGGAKKSQKKKTNPARFFFGLIRVPIHVGEPLQ